MFGQSEVRITSQGILQFNRRGKSCKLYGNHQDGSYRITKMYECKLDRWMIYMTILADFFVKILPLSLSVLVSTDR